MNGSISSGKPVVEQAAAASCDVADTSDTLVDLNSTWAVMEAGDCTDGFL